MSFSLEHSAQITTPKKVVKSKNGESRVGSDLGSIGAEIHASEAQITQNQSKRVKKIDTSILIRDQGGGSLNPLSPKKEQVKRNTLLGYVGSPWTTDLQGLTKPSGSCKCLKVSRKRQSLPICHDTIDRDGRPVLAHDVVAPLNQETQPAHQQKQERKQE
jgi:hypothetical protein